MELNEYQRLAGITAGAGGADPERRLMVAALGLVGEAGEFGNLVKKKIAHGHKDITGETFADELGDVLWYVAEAATAAGLTLEAICRQNVEKLQRRYPEGFSEDASRSRTS